MAKSADAPKTMTRTMTLKRTTKGTAVYDEGKSEGGELFPTVYVQKTALPDPAPTTITITVTV